MDKDRIAGSAKQAGGAITEAAGKLTGDAKLKAEGSAEKAAGKIQNAVGGMKDAVRDAVNNCDFLPQKWLRPGAAFFCLFGKACEFTKLPRRTLPSKEVILCNASRTMGQVRR
jgi:uncharacterized protein YjbJ (UPF0337 family)